MYYKLSNGDRVCLRTNLEAAKFVYLVMPFRRLHFIDDVKPKITIDDKVRKVIEIYDKMCFRQQMRDREIERIAQSMIGFDDKIPF
ncbi:hypothetical protein [Salmonella phage 7-11]|uniref:Uncharacterized protein n=1 Tax=Salmonella phage 7-11 TaxID=1054968 RepID=G0X531_9CAUD|nr:hypothetical protein SaPh711_gp098 [Salmonella phage 7-11]AEK82013.1 hypothetical protein [Salmonella phage 7-11]